MKRRSFLQYSAVAIAGGVFGGIGGILPRIARASEVGQRDFSLDVITNQPDLAIARIQRAIAGSPFSAGTTTVTEQPLVGTHWGDIALVTAHELVDYRNRTDALSRQLQEIARTLALPARYDNPSLVRFYSESPSRTADALRVVRGDVCLAQLPLSGSDGTYTIGGAQGSLKFTVRDHAVRITDASCTHQTCMKMGAISQPGQTLVCVPNKISMTLTGRNAFGVDGVTGFRY